MLRKLILGLVAVVAVALFPPRTEAQEVDVRGSVVKILATQRLPDPFRPWTKQQPRDMSGSGVVIEGNRILTNAHVVGFVSQLYVQPYQSAEKLEAEVIAVAPGVDLAIIELEDGSFFDEHPAVPLLEALPKLRQTINVYGYPEGGNELSVTEGIISRVEYAGLSSGTLGVRVQVDAALNPGNSGGPAIVDGQVVGLVTSGIRSAENIGYLIHTEEIRRFLDDVADGAYDGKPDLQDVVLQTTENDALRSRLMLPDDVGGVMVTKILSPDPVASALRPWDVITRIGDQPIDREGQIRANEDLRFRFRYLIPRMAEDGRVAMTVYRDGEPMELSVPVSQESSDVMAHLAYNYPPYFIYGPMVFSKLSNQVIEALGGRGIQAMASVNSPIATRAFGPKRFEDEEIVLLSSPLLPNRVTKGYSSMALAVVSHVNGVEIRNLVHLVETLRDLDTRYVEFRFAGSVHESLVFERDELDGATEEILTDNGIRYQMSEDLRDVWRR